MRPIDKKFAEYFRSYEKIDAQEMRFARRTNTVRDFVENMYQIFDELFRKWGAKPPQQDRFLRQWRRSLGLA